MDSLTKNWQKAISAQARAKLGRSLSEVEKEFIESRQSYIALEVIEDAVQTLHGKDLTDYLNSEHPGQVHD